MAAALAHCHAAGVVHRDLKPDNIKQRPDGVVKVLDLGLARPLAPAAGVWTSGERAMVGTVPYFSPEHFAGCPEAPADQFSLGVVLYEMLTGVRPFTGDTVLSLHTAVTTTAPRSPRDLRPEVDGRLAGLVLRMLARNPEERFSSLDAVREELGPYLNETVPTPVPAARRWRWAAGIAATVLIGSAVGWQLGRPNPRPVDPPRQPAELDRHPQDLTGVLSRVAADLAALPAQDQEHQRYFRLGHLEPAERPATRDAVATLLPKLSASGAVVPLADVGGDGTLLRLDLRALGWKAEEWSLVARRCPLSVRYAGPDLPPAGGTIRKLLNTDLTPFVLADWFASAASSDPLLGELVPEERATAVRGSERLRQFRDGYDRAPGVLRRAAAELGLGSPDSLKAVLLAKDELTRRLELSPWLDDKPVPRGIWNRSEIGVCPAAELATELKLGIRLIVTTP